MREQVENGMRETLYDILEVSRTASPEVIRAAYKSLVQRFHPDKNPDNPNAEDLLKLINNAYDTLSDASKRAAYDVMLALEDLASPQAPPEEERGSEEPMATAEPETDQAFAEKWDLYQAFIGKNPNYYRPIFRRFHVTGKTAGAINWMALFAGGGWAAYRKLYGVALFHFVLLAAGVALTELLTSPLKLLALLPFFGMSAWLALSANALYFRRTSRKISEISRLDGDGAEIFRKVHLAGGVNALAPFIFAILAVVAFVASIWLSSPRQPAKVQSAVPTRRIESRPTPIANAPEFPAAEAPEPKPEPKPKPELNPEPVPVPAAKPVPRPVEKHQEKPKPAVSAREAPPPAVAMIEPTRRPAIEAQKYLDLATAVSSGDRAAVEIMLREGEDVNLVKNNQVPLIIAVKNGDIAMVRLLIAHGADVNLTDNQGNAAMIYAKVRADAKMIDILKNAGAKNPFN